MAETGKVYETKGEAVIHLSTILHFRAPLFFQKLLLEFGYIREWLFPEPAEFYDLQCMNARMAAEGLL